jgi:hypothetical protein
MNRLRRKPSLWMNFFGRLAFAIVWVGFMFGFTFMVWTRSPAGKTPIFVWIILGIFNLFAVGMIWDIVVRFWRTLWNRQPIVEIDRQSLRLGETAQLRIVEEHPESVSQMRVRLVAEHWVTTKNGGTTITAFQPCFDQELLQMNLPAGETVTRMLQIRIPETAPAEDAKWKIVVSSELRQGGVIDHPYPISVKGRAI